MKMAKTGRRRARRDMGASFVRGFVATGLLAAVQDRAARKGGRRERRRLLRLALQGGTALAAGGAAADALQSRDWSRALTAVAAGGLGMLALERVLQDKTDQENGNGQEETQEAHEAGGLPKRHARLARRA